MQRLASQRHRMHRVVNFAQTHLAEALDLDRMAEVACLSKFHFTRTFRSHYGETPIQFLWRLRLDEAARSLVIRRDKSITQVALDCGFSSSPTFSRAFRQRFGVAPRTLKAADSWFLANLTQTGQTLLASGGRSPKAQADRWERLPVRIERRLAVRVAYIRRIGPYWNFDGGISQTFASLERWAKAKGLWTGATELIGNCPNNSAVTPAPYCVYDACLPVSDEVGEDDSVSIQEIPGGTYAMFGVRGSSADLESAWNWLTLTWLPSNGLTCELSHSYELIPLHGGTLSSARAGAELCLRLAADSFEDRRLA